MQITGNHEYGFSQYSNYLARKDSEDNFLGKVINVAAQKKEAENAQMGEKKEESLDEKLKRLDDELERIRQENRRERERQQELRLKKKRQQKKIAEKLVLKKYLARQDEIQQLNEKISLERSVGEDVYIEKAPLSKSLSVAEIMAICSES